MGKAEAVATGVFLYFVTICIFYGAYLKSTQDSYERGYENGFIVGENLGYENGYSAGYGGGYDKGYIFGLYVGQPFENGIRDPIYREMIDFLERDNTDQREYSTNYMCTHFAHDVWKNAQNENIRCAQVALVGANHRIIAFDTIDRGLIFVEPQTDETDVQIIDTSQLDEDWEVTIVRPTWFVAEYIVFYWNDTPENKPLGHCWGPEDPFY